MFKNIPLWKMAATVCFSLLSFESSLAFPLRNTPSLANIPHAESLQDTTFRQILTIYQTKTGTAWARSMSNLLDKDAVMIEWQGKQLTPIRGKDQIETYLNQEVGRYPELKKEVGRFMVAGGQVSGGSDPYGSVLVVFYQGSTKPKVQKPWVWA